MKALINKYLNDFIFVIDQNYVEWRVGVVNADSTGLDAKSRKEALGEAHDQVRKAVEKLIEGPDEAFR